VYLSIWCFQDGDCLAVVVVVIVLVAAIFWLWVFSLKPNKCFSRRPEIHRKGRRRRSSRKLLRQLQETLTHLHTQSHKRTLISTYVCVWVWVCMCVWVSVHVSFPLCPSLFAEIVES